MIFRKKNISTIEDKALGPLKFHKDKDNPEESYWECGRSMDFYVKNDQGGISMDQRTHVILIEEKLSELMPQIQHYINQNTERTYDINKHLEVSWIELENDTNQELSWAIDFEFKDSWEHLVVEMKNLTPVGLSFWA